MKWNKETISSAIKEAKSKMEKFTANNYQSWITGKTDIYPIIKHIYRVYGSWNDMKREVFGDEVDILRDNKYNGNEDEMIELLRKLIPKVSKVTLKNITKAAGGDFPSQSCIVYHFGSWTNMKNIAADYEIETYSNKPQECLDCGIGRCRFDYSISECEYF